MRFYLVGIVVLVLQVARILAGECCNSFYDDDDVYQDGFYCEVYCCKRITSNPLLRIYVEIVERECCSAEADRAPEEDINNFCQEWWSKNKWAPALIALGAAAVIVAIAAIVYFFGIKPKLAAKHSSRIDIAEAPDISHEMGAPMPGPSCPSVLPAYTAEAPPAYEEFQQLPGKKMW